MDIEREAEIPVDKVYTIPAFEIVPHKGFFLAVMPNIARWVVLKNNRQLEIFNELVRGLQIGKVLELHEDFQDDIQDVLVQIEATQVDRLKPKSNFTNTRLHLHLTNQCNMCCPHCYVCAKKAYDNELTTDEVKDLCRYFKETGGTDVSLTGGEPTLRLDFFEIVEYISQLGMKVSVYTNGLNWSEEKIKKLSMCSVDGVQISVDGYDERTNSIFRNKGAFLRVLEVIDMMIKNNIHIKISVTPPFEALVENHRKYIDFAKCLLDKYGEDRLEINFSYSLMPGREMTTEFIDSIRERYRSYIDEIVRTIRPHSKEDSFVANISDCVYDSCGYGGLNVLANGDFYFCDRLSDVVSNGNIRKLPFAEIRRLMALAEEAGKIDHFRPCKDCVLKYICGGGCRAEYFRQFTQLKSVQNVDYGSIEPRKCSDSDKERIYDLMLKTTEMFYR